MYKSPGHPPDNEYKSYFHDDHDGVKYESAPATSEGKWQNDAIHLMNAFVDHKKAGRETITVPINK